MRTIAAPVSAPALRMRARWRPFLLLATALAPHFCLLWAEVGLAKPIRWTPAVFRGLTAGSSNRADALRVLGPADTSHALPNGGLFYKGRGDHQGDLTIFFDRSGAIREIHESFPIAVPRSRIYKELGRDAVTALFSRNKCGDLYRDPKGSIELTFYPARGIYLWPDQYGYDFAAIYYAARPPGADRSPACGSRK